MKDAQYALWLKWSEKFETVDEAIEWARNLGVPELEIARFEARYYRELYGQWQDEAWRLRALIPGETH